MNSEIRENLLKTVKLLTNSKPCISQGNAECAALTLFADLISNTNKTVQLSTGKLQKLFVKFEALESLAIQKIQSLPKGSTQQVITTICTVCNGTSYLIQEYLAQSPKTPTAD